MLNAEQLQWIKHRVWARFLFFVVIFLLPLMAFVAVSFFIIFGDVWQKAHVHHKFLVLGEFSLLAGFLMAFVLWLMLILLWPIAKKSTKRLKEYIRLRLLNDLPAPELEPTPCPVGVLQIHKPFQYFPPTVLGYFLPKKHLLPMLCFVDGTPVASLYFGEPTQITLPVGNHEICMKRWVLPTMGGEPKEVFCSTAVSIEIVEGRIVVLVYRFKEAQLLGLLGAVLLILWLFSWNPYNWFDVLNIVLPYPWNTPVLYGWFRVLLAEVCWLLLTPLWRDYALKPVLEVLKAEDIPPSR